jgi:transcriptional regulator with XRE-family HTH domain
MSTNLGTRIHALRRERGLTQRELAEEAGIDFTYLSKIENSALPYSPSAKTLKKLASVLKVDELEFLRLADKLPTELGAITHTEEGIRFLRKASKVVGPDDWEDLMAFLEQKRKERNK